MGAHMLEKSWKERRMDLDEATVQKWKTAWNNGWVINMSGSASTLAVASNKLIKRPTPIAALIGGGTLVFSLSTYTAAYFADRRYSIAGPVGGSSIILGWLWLLVAP